MAAIEDEWPCTPRCCRIAAHLLLMALVAVELIYLVLFCIDNGKVARVSVGLAAFDGMNATVGRTVSPGFNLTARVENPRALVPWCSAGGRAVVSYGGVSLAWGPVPAFCAPEKGALELEVAAKGKGVGLKDELRRRFAAEWNAGTARVAVEMKLLYDGNGFSGSCAFEGVSFVWAEFLLPRQVPSGPSQAGGYPNPIPN